MAIVRVRSHLRHGTENATKTRRSPLGHADMGWRRTVSDTFPGLGHRYLVDFGTWKTQLYFSSTTSLSYTGVAADGSLGAPETVKIAIDPVRDQLFLVTWQESDKTTVVHLEDYKEYRIVTHITSPDGSFDIFHGSFAQVG
jgi:hypothetical protein